MTIARKGLVYNPDEVESLRDASISAKRTTGQTATERTENARRYLRRVARYLARGEALPTSLILPLLEALDAAAAAVDTQEMGVAFAKGLGLNHGGRPQKASRAEIVGAVHQRIREMLAASGGTEETRDSAFSAATPPAFKSVAAELGVSVRTVRTAWDAWKVEEAKALA